MNKPQLSARAYPDELFGAKKHLGMLAHEEEKVLGCLPVVQFRHK